MTETTPPSAPVKAPLPGPPRRRWLSLLLCTLIFLCGGVIGAGVTVLAPWEDEWPRPKRTVQQRRDRLTERLAEKLDLRADQTEALRGIIEQRLENLEVIRRSILPKVQAEAEALNRRLTPLLTEEQAVRWRELYATLSARWSAPPDETPATQPAGAPAQP